MDTFFILSAKYLMVVPVIVLGIYFLLRPWSSKKRMVVFAVPSLLLTLLLAFIAGHLYYDPRPFVVGNFTPLIPHATDNGFPSDHALLVTALAMLASFWNRKMGFVLWLVAIIVMIARVYVGVHHPIDVIGSAIISVLSVSVVYALFRQVWRQEVQ